MRLLLAVLFGVAACAGITSEVLDALMGFSGEIYVNRDMGEQIVVRETVPKRAWDAWSGLTFQRNALPNEIPFKGAYDSARLLNPQKRYDALTLPFVLKLKQADVMTEEEPANQLKIRTPEGEQIIDFKLNQDLQFGEDKTQWHVDAVRKWSGLLSDPQGEPMIRVALRKPSDPQWTEGITLPSATWRRIEPRIGIHFEWFPNEDTARQLTRIEAATPARWGLVDGNMITWQENFTPGGGGTLHNKTSVTLLQWNDQQDPPVILVRLVDQKGTRDVQITANNPSPEIPVVYEDYGRLDTVLLFSAWKEGQAFAVAYQHHQPCGESVLDVDTPWTPAGLPYQVRIDQVIEKGVVVAQQDSKVPEVVFSSENRKLHIRQGEAVREGDSLLEFSRKTKPSAIQYAFSVTGEGKDASLIIQPDDTVHFRHYRFSQGNPGPDPLHAAVLRVEARAEHPWRRVMLALFLIGLVLLLVWQMAHHPEMKNDVKDNNNNENEVAS